MASSQIILYSKPGCCLCERAKAQLKQLQKQHQFVLREINILEDLAAYNMFKDEIPVVFIGGSKVFKYHLDEKQFIRLLESAGRRQDAGNTSA